MIDVTTEKLLTLPEARAAAAGSAKHLRNLAMAHEGCQRPEAGQRFHRRPDLHVRRGVSPIRAVGHQRE